MKIHACAATVASVATLAIAPLAAAHGTCWRADANRVQSFADAGRFERSACVPYRRRQHLRLVARPRNDDARRHDVSTDLRTAKRERAGTAIDPDAVG